MCRQAFGKQSLIPPQLVTCEASLWVFVRSFSFHFPIWGVLPPSWLAAPLLVPLGVPLLLRVNAISLRSQLACALALRLRHFVLWTHLCPWPSFFSSFSSFFPHFQSLHQGMLRSERLWLCRDPEVNLWMTPILVSLRLVQVLEFLQLLPQTFTLRLQPPW